MLLLWPLWWPLKIPLPHLSFLLITAFINIIIIELLEKINITRNRHPHIESFAYWFLILDWACIDACIASKAIPESVSNVESTVQIFRLRSWCTCHTFLLLFFLFKTISSATTCSWLLFFLISTFIIVNLKIITCCFFWAFCVLNFLVMLPRNRSSS